MIDETQIVLIIELVLILLFSIALYCFYIKKNTFFLVGIVTVFLWFLNFGLIVLIPFDIYYNIKQTKKSEKDINNTILSISYGCSYWIIFVLSWVFLPVLKEYENRGEFTKMEKLKGAIKSNIMFYVILGIVAGVGLIGCVIYVIVSTKEFVPFFQSLYIFCIDASNFYGLLFIIFMLGYSIPKIPLSLWGKLNNAKRIKYLEFKTGSICQDIVKGKKDLLKYGHQIQATLDDLRYEDDKDKNEIEPYETNLEEILQEYKDNKELYEIDLNEDRNDEKSIKKVSDLITLHSTIKKTQNNILFLNCQLKKLYKEWKFRKSLTLYQVVSTDENKKEPLDNDNFEPVEISGFKRFYHLKLKPILIIIAIVLVLAFDAILLFSEVAFFAGFDGCVFGLIIKKVSGFFAVHVFTIVPLLAIYYFTTFSLFRMQISLFIGVHGNHHTNSFSILFLTNFICTIGFALGVHFLDLIKISDTEKTKMTETTKMTKMTELYGFKLTTFLQQIMQFFFSIFLILLVIIQYFNVFNKVMSCLGFPTFGDSDESKEIESDGRRYLHDLDKEIKKSKDLDMKIDI